MRLPDAEGGSFVVVGAGVLLFSALLAETLLFRECPAGETSRDTPEPLPSGSGSVMSGICIPF
jgi:hypothetical protein